MRTFLLTLLMGVVAGAIDVLPMIKRKLDRYSIASAFVFYLLLPFVIVNLNLFHTIWWAKGGIVALGLALPVILVVAKNDKKAVPPMLVMSTVLGTLIGIAAHFVL